MTSERGWPGLFASYVPRNCTAMTLLDIGSEMFAPETSMLAPASMTNRPVPGCALKLSGSNAGCAEAVTATFPAVAVISLPLASTIV